MDSIRRVQITTSLFIFCDETRRKREMRRVVNWWAGMSNGVWFVLFLLVLPCLVLLPLVSFDQDDSTSQRERRRTRAMHA